MRFFVKRGSGGQLRMVNKAPSGGLGPEGPVGRRNPMHALPGAGGRAGEWVHRGDRKSVQPRCLSLESAAATIIVAP